MPSIMNVVLSCLDPDQNSGVAEGPGSEELLMTSAPKPTSSINSTTSDGGRV